MVDGKLMLSEHPTDIWVRHSYDDKEIPQCISFLKKRRALSGFECSNPKLLQN